jgi:hypothetical protein
MPLTNAQMSAAIRHLGYPVRGLLRVSPSGGSVASALAGYRYFQAYGTLLYRLISLNPDEEARLVGSAYAAIALIGPQPNQGDTISVTLSGGNLSAPQTISATAGAPVGPGGDGRLNLLATLVSQAAQNAALQTAEIFAVAPFGSGPYSESQIPVPECAFTSPVPFTIAATGSGVSYPQITATGEQLPPSTSLDGTTTVYGYLPILDGLENAFLSASQNLDTIIAGPWKGRSNEIGQRMSLYELYRGMLSDFLGIPVNPDKYSRPAKHGALKFA